MRVTLAYGPDGLDVEVPDGSVVVGPSPSTPLADEEEAVRRALRSPGWGRPLGELVGAGDQVVVVFPDITRPMPNTTVLPPLLDELARAGAGPERVELLCATGTHRPATPAELADLVGWDIVDRYRIHQHRAEDGDHVSVGQVDGVPVLLDRRYVAADRRILTGFVEPHFFAGWSGGPKGTCPGLAATSTILEAHSPARIADARSTWLTTTGNPVHDFVRAATALCPPDLSVDVTIDDQSRLTGVFAGPLPDGHRAACAAAARAVIRSVPGRFDVVLTTNGGYPLDRNLYQSVKGLAAAERVVADGGTIVMAAACTDGVPGDGAFARILESASGVGELAHPAGPAQVDGWQAQVLARVLARSAVWFHSNGLSDHSIRSAGMLPVRDLATGLEEALAAGTRHHGRTARLCVLPRGPLTVATSSGARPV
jgi:nickel-dependent lactate racemase